MGGYVKILNKDIPFYISLAEDGKTKYREKLHEAMHKHTNFKKSGKVRLFKLSTWFIDNDIKNDLWEDCEWYNRLFCDYTNIVNMLCKAKDKDIYVDIESFYLLEKMNDEN
jgi:hypothetical protein